MAQTTSNVSNTGTKTGTGAEHGQPDTGSIEQDQPSPEQSSAAVPGSLKIADLAAGQGLTDRYDDVLLKLCGTSVHLSPAAVEDGATRFCHHVRHALNADTAYLCNRASLSVVTTSSRDSARDTCEDTQAIHTALTTMVSDLWNCEAPLCPPDIKVYPDEAGFSYLVIPLSTQHDQLLIITNADTDKTLVGDYLADALTAIYQLFLTSKGVAPAASVCESTVFDSLHCKYQISSRAITRKRLEHYQSLLKTHAVEFEGLSLASRSTKADELQSKLPDSLYNTAMLWHNKFRSALDCHALVESAHGYKTLCDNESLLKFSDSRSLKVKVHAESLTDLNYIATLQDLTEKSVIHASRLKFSVIPQSGQKHAEALRTLQDRFGIPHSADLLSDETRANEPNANEPLADEPRVKEPRAKAAHSFADEFDMLQVNGVKKKTASRQS